MSRLRARCPDCRTLTAVAVGPEYECHACGRVFAAGLVRVEGQPTAAVPYPETARVTGDEPDLAGLLPERAVVLGGDAAFHERCSEAFAGRGAYVLVDELGDVDGLERRLAETSAREAVAGLGFCGEAAGPAHRAAIERLARAAGL